MSSAALILHDDEPTLTQMRGLLETAGFETASATSAYRLLALELAAPPKLVLLGMTAVEERDVEVVAILRRRWPDAWILALFPAALRERAAYALSRGADACLPEPFYPGEVLAIARRVAARGASPPSQPIVIPQPEASPLAALAAGLAHMIRNPLQAVTLQLETAESGRVDVPKMTEQVARIDAVVEDLARCAGTRGTSSEPIEVVAFVEKVFGKGKKKAASAAIHVHADVERADVVGSSELLKSVFETLKRRAERVTPAAGRIDVRVRVRAEGARRFVEVAVTDGGPRLNDAQRARLFEPFSDTAALQDGTGLELAAMAGVVRGHGGSTSAPAGGEGGTTIVVRLPAAAAKGKAT